MPPSCLGHVRQSTVRLNHTRAPTYGKVSIRPRTLVTGFFSITVYALTLQSLISFGILTHLLVAHYRRPIGLPRAPRLSNPKEWSLTLSQHPPEVLRLPIIPVCPYFIQLSLSERLFVFNGITYAS